MTIKGYPGIYNQYQPFRERLKKEYVECEAGITNEVRSILENASFCSNSALDTSELRDAQK